jgi:hypothetical protein
MDRDAQSTVRLPLTRTVILVRSVKRCSGSRHRPDGGDLPVDTLPSGDFPPRRTLEQPGGFVALACSHSSRLLCHARPSSALKESSRLYADGSSFLVRSGRVQVRTRSTVGAWPTPIELALEPFRLDRSYSRIPRHGGRSAHPRRLACWLSPQMVLLMWNRIVPGS